MADVTGPTSTLPGAHHKVPAGAMCDYHPDRPAVRRVQGETDSFGSEMIDWCEECYKQYLEHKEQDSIGICYHCKGLTPLFPWRDYEEGSCGPVYHLCAPCKSAQTKRENEELADCLSDRIDY
jgi:hypothetical protein